MNDNITFGDKIFNLRKQKGMTQEQLAEAVGVSRQTIHKWENNFIQPSPDNIESLSNILGVKSIELLSLIYPVEKIEEIENLCLSNDNEEKSEVAVADQEVKVKQESVKTKFVRNSIILVIFLAVMLFISIMITIWMGFMLGESQSGDVKSSNYSLNEDVFILMLIISIFLMLMESVLIVYIIIKKRHRK